MAGGDFREAARNISRKEQKPLSKTEQSLAPLSGSGQSVSGHSANSEQNNPIAPMVRQFIASGTGIFKTNDVTTYVCATNRKEKQCVYSELNKLLKSGKINKINGKVSTWEIAEPEPETMNIADEPAEPVNIPFPLGISEMANRDGKYISRLYCSDFRGQQCWKNSLSFVDFGPIAHQHACAVLFL